MGRGTTRRVVEGPSAGLHGTVGHRGRSQGTVTVNVPRPETSLGWRHRSRTGLGGQGPAVWGKENSMGISLYELSVPTFLQTVRALRGVLARAAAHCAETGGDPDD